MIAQAERPMIYYGGGVGPQTRGRTSAGADEKSGLIPSAHTIWRSVAFPDGPEPAQVWAEIGMHGTVFARVGGREPVRPDVHRRAFSDRVATNRRRFRAEGKGLVHIDIDAAEINKNIGVDYAVVSDAENFLEKLLP